MTPEGRIKKEIKAYLDSIGAYHIWPVSTGYGPALLDCYASVKGHFVAIEVKASGKKPTPRQELTMQEILAKGGASFWCYVV
jgi:hypothetical protein